tara:strand:+ start:71 stop:697 length:627 start_codon:yes stop_codon:yes gene_type:complete
METDYRDFVGIFDNSVPVELCSEFVANYEIAKRNRTFIDVSKENELGVIDNPENMVRKDEVHFVTPIFSTLYPNPPVMKYFEYLSECFKLYREKFDIGFSGIITNDIFKIHKVGKTEGFHKWHYEKGEPGTLDRLLVYMTYLVVPEKGGETEFLYQSLRLKPIVGRTLIWPAGFTHRHRGNPPLDGVKMYITGWFKTVDCKLDDIGGR